MNYIGIIVPIAIGSLIGYCTNYIAIKMLFRPRKEVRIFGKRLPFTPGVIPKNKPRVARACGKAVGENLVTGGDIKNVLLGDDVKKKFSSTVADIICSDNLSLGTVMESIDTTGGDGLAVRASVMLTEKIKTAAAEVDYKEVIGNVASGVIAEKFAGTMMAMFINDSTIAAITEPIGDSIKDHINAHGQEIIYPVVKKNLDEAKSVRPKDILDNLQVDREKLENLIGELYIDTMGKYAEDIIGHVDIAYLVEKKINDMSVEMLEDLVMSVMKNELQAVINLGALIGAIIGILNVFVL